MESGSFPTLDALHFPSAQQSISQTLSSLRRSALSVSNRLGSIKADADFVREAANHYDLPLVANERCGSWYISPDAKVGSAYFKSTDGHTGQWDFSFRRLNLQLLPLAREHGGLVYPVSRRQQFEMIGRSDHLVAVSLSRSFFWTFIGSWRPSSIPGRSRTMTCMDWPQLTSFISTL